MFASVWLFTFVAADLGSHLLLPHFLNFYSPCIPAHQFKVLVNHDPNKEASYPEGLSEVEKALMQHNIRPVYWVGQFYPARKIKLKLENMLDIPEQDWILEVDADEFCDFPGGSLTRFIQELDRKGINYVPGRMVDRFSPTAQLEKIEPLQRSTSVQTGMSIWAQFPQR